mgnify:CR=1 FL=1
MNYDFAALRRMYSDPSKNDWSFEAISFALEHVYNVSLLGVCFVPAYLRDRVMNINPSEEFDRADLLHSITRLTTSRLQPGMFPLKHPTKYRTEHRIVAFLIHDDGRRRHGEQSADEEQLPESHFAHWSVMALNLEETDPWFYHYDSLEDYSLGVANHYATRLMQLGLIIPRHAPTGVRSPRTHVQPSDRSCGFWCLMNIIGLATKQIWGPKKVLDTLLNAVDYVPRLGAWENLNGGIVSPAVLQNQIELVSFLQHKLSQQCDGLFMEPERRKSILWVRRVYKLALLYVDTRDELCQLSSWMGIQNITTESHFHGMKLCVIVLDIPSDAHEQQHRRQYCMDRLFSYLLALSFMGAIGPTAHESALIVKESLRTYTFNLHRHAIGKNCIVTNQRQTRDVVIQRGYQLGEKGLLLRMRNTLCLEAEETAFFIRSEELRHWMYRNRFAQSTRSFLTEGVHYSIIRPVINLMDCVSVAHLIMDVQVHWTLWNEIARLHRADVAQQFSQLPPDAPVCQYPNEKEVHCYLLTLMEKAE